MKFLRNAKDKVTRTFGRQVFVTKKHSPVILFGLGMVGVTTTVVLACRATLKLSDVLEEGENSLKKIDPENAKTSDEEDELKKASFGVRLQIAIKIAKLYAPAAAVGVISVGALTGSHVILNRRNIGLTAAYTALDKGYKEYRERVAAEFGEAKETELRYGMVDKEIAVETDTGTDVKTVKVIPSNGGRSIYARCFDEINSRKWQRAPHMNQAFIASQQEYANNRLRARGFLTLNEVYRALGLDECDEGLVVGWVYNGDGDNLVDFGIFGEDDYMGEMFITGNESSVWLDFNVDGPIYGALGKGCE